jgi:hypothetical protein
VDAGSRSPDALQPYTSTAGASSLAARVTNLETRESERERPTDRARLKRARGIEPYVGCSLGAGLGPGPLGGWRPC